MICKHCGEQLPDSVKFCTSCGAPQTESQNVPQSIPQQEEIPVYEAQVVGSSQPVGFLEAVKRFFLHYADFNGRSRRSEYWWVFLFNTIVGSVIGAIAPDFSWIWTLAIMVPTLALVVRRLHDVGKRGWFYLWFFLPLAGGIVILIQMLKDSAPDNQWGPNPKA